MDNSKEKGANYFYGYYGVLESNDGKSVIVRRRYVNARRYFGKRLDGRAKCHCNLRRYKMYETQSGNTHGGAF